MNNLTLLRRKKGISQADLAQRLGISRSELSRLENGWFSRVQPHVEKSLRKIFGPQWSFAALMEEPPEPRPEASAAK